MTKTLLRFGSLVFFFLIFSYGQFVDANAQTGFTITSCAGSVPGEPRQLSNPVGIYLDLVDYSGAVSVTFTTTEESSVFHTIIIPGVATIAENVGQITMRVAGGRCYGPCRATYGNLWIGSETPLGGGNTRLIVEEGGDDWNDMTLEVNRGFFRRGLRPAAR